MTRAYQYGWFSPSVSAWGSIYHQLQLSVRTYTFKLRESDAPPLLPFLHEICISVAVIVPSSAMTLRINAPQVMPNASMRMMKRRMCCKCVMDQHPIAAAKRESLTRCGVDASP